MANKVHYREAIVTYMDILGFGGVLSNFSADEIYNIIKLFHFQYSQDSLSNHIEYGKSYDTDIHFFSDSVVRVKYTDFEDLWLNTASDEVISLALMQLELFKNDILVRGGCTKGMIYSDSSSNILFGPALVEAHKMECTLSVYPRIIISQNILEDYFRDITTTVHWIKADGSANRGLDFMQGANPKYSTSGWEKDAELLKLRHDPLKKQWFVNYFWGPASADIYSLHHKKELLHIVETYLLLMANVDKLVEKGDVDDRIKIKNLWCRFQLHETIKDIYEWINGFEMSSLLNPDILERLAEQSTLFFRRYGLI